MVKTLTLDLSSLDTGFPDSLFILKQGETKVWVHTYGVKHGLACFSTEKDALAYRDKWGTNGCTPCKTTFDDAYDIAKEKAKSQIAPLTCLILCDAEKTPVFYDLQN